MISHAVSRLRQTRTGGAAPPILFLQYSHAVIKRPAAGDFRVQGELGGSASAAPPPDHLIDAARRILSLSPSPLLYARVDGVERAGRFMLMELEINEPYLFLGMSSDAATRFADAIEAVL